MAGTGTAEDRIEALEAELAATRLEHEQFIYAASHDLRAPLRALMVLPGWIRDTLIERHGGVHDALEIDLHEIEVQSQRLDSLLMGLLEYSRVGRLYDDVRQIDTGAAIAACLDDLPEAAAFEISIAPDLPAAHCDPKGFALSMRHLVANAVRHHDRPHGRIEISGHEQHGIAHFRVADDGPGIDEAFHDRIFKLFTTLKPRDEVEGSGAGLAVVRKFAELAGGSVRIEPNRTGRGACFTLSLPVGPAAEESPMGVSGTSAVPEAALPARGASATG